MGVGLNGGWAAVWCAILLGLNPARYFYFTGWTGIMNTSLATILPMLLILVFFQRCFVQGIAGSGLR